MPATVTLTGKAGPAKTLTATVFNNVSSFLIDADKNMVTLFLSNGETVSPISVDDASVVTGTKAGNVWTLVIGTT